MTQLPDGIYFDLPEDDYHAQHRLSASGIRDMLCSPATFWANSWMNPDRDDDDTAARVIGRAYHCARFEPAEFHNRFVRRLEKEDFPDALTTDTEIKAVLKDMGQPQAKPGETVMDRAVRLRDLGHQGEIWHLWLAMWEHDKGDRQAVPAKVWSEIERDMKRLRQMPEVAEHLTGGIAEVSILWTDPRHGVPMKARLDYLKPASFTDFKTFDNSMGRHLDEAIRAAFRFNGYYVQGAVYWQATEVIRKADLPVHGEPTGAQLALIREIRASDRPLRAWFVFQEKKGIPNILAREYAIFHLHTGTIAAAPDQDAEAQMRLRFAEHSRLYNKADTLIDYAKRAFRTHSEAFGSDPWFPFNAVGKLEDADYSETWLLSDW